MMALWVLVHGSCVIGERPLLGWPGSVPVPKVGPTAWERAFSYALTRPDCDQVDPANLFRRVQPAGCQGESTATSRRWTTGVREFSHYSAPVATGGDLSGGRKYLAGKSPGLRVRALPHWRDPNC